MKKLFFIVFFMLGFVTTNVLATNNTFLDYQNYNHGYCPDCNSCPCNCPAQPYQSCPLPQDNCPNAQPYNQNIQPCYPNSTPSCPSCPNHQSQACPQSPCQVSCPLPPCDPGAPIAGTNTGVSICAIGISLLAVGAAAALIVTSNNGSNHTH